MAAEETPNKTLPAWTEKKILDQFEFNNTNQQIFEARYDPNQSAFKTIKQMFMDKYSYDIMGEKTGPYLAIVLEVLSGPRANNAASTKDNKTNTINIESLRDPSYKDKEGNLKEPPIRVIARVPEFDLDIDWPEDNEDHVRIASHSEFHSMHDTNKTNGVDLITAGSSIWVTYNNTENLTGFDGRAVGRVIGLQSQPAHPVKLNLVQKAKNAHNPPCKSVRQLSGPSAGLYVGQTVAEVHDAGPPIKRLKNRIKTGMHGNGTPQTKAHFDAALNHSKPSVKHSIPGAAPDSRNAFVWVGHLKNNGYMDILDRPLSPGRETIIYAPMMLDLASPIEIKYYFHDQAGFGHAWIHGPDTDLGSARSTADSPHGNDFKEHIGPAIKDLIKDGRNFILVIPEMAHSRGFGTISTATERFEKITKGKKMPPGAPGMGEKIDITIRTYMAPGMSALVKTYLRNLPTSAFYQAEGVIDEAIPNNNLLQYTHLKQRETATFDGSYSGGNFGLFHQEVLDVLNEYLGTVDDKISYVSILANGLGGVSLASIVQHMPSTPSHHPAAEAFKGVPIKRIDFIDSGKDVFGDHGFPESPSYAIYKYLLLPKSSSPGFSEFNYVTDLIGERYLFTKLQVGSKYAQHNNAVSDYGEQKFSFFVNQSANQENYISLHMATTNKKVGYAFSMVNTFLTDYENIPSAKQSDSSNHPSFDSVPDHAGIIASKPSAADVSTYEKEAKKLEEKNKFFEDFIVDAQNDMAGVCKNSSYAIFCEAGFAHGSRRSGAIVFSTYTTYLRNKRRLYELLGVPTYADLLINNIIALKEIENNTVALGQELASAKQMLEEVKAFNKKSSDGSPNIYEGWQEINTSVFLDNILAGEVVDAVEYIALHAGQLAMEDAYIKIVARIENTISEAEPEAVDRPSDCQPPPRRMSDFDPTGLSGRLNLFSAFPARSSDRSSRRGSKPTCSGKNIIVPASYEELVDMIPWFPEKEDFSYVNDRFSKDATKIKDKCEGGYEATKFRYKARAAFSGHTFHESPPIWACIVDLIAKAWDIACTVSNYEPFKVVTGIKGSFQKRGVTAYKAGIPLSTFGLAFSVDPQLTGYSTDSDPLHSIFTGAWTPVFVENYAGELYNLGVLDDGWIGPGATFLNNAYSDPGARTRRKTGDWYWAEHSYNGDLVEGEEISATGSELEDSNIDYDDIMDFAKDGPIIKPGADPVLWLLTFCEKSGMKWGNTQFLKKRHRGGVTWSLSEQRRIAAIYGIPDIVARINAISWSDTAIENHMHFQFYDGPGLIKWSEMSSVRNKLGK